MSIVANFFNNALNGTSEQKAEAKRFFKDILEAQYLGIFIRRQRLLDKFPLPRPPRPDFESIKRRGDPDPQPNLPTDIRSALLGDLLINALGDPNPEPSKPLYINQIRESGLHTEVIKELITQFENGTRALKDELEILNNKKKC